MNSSHGFSRFLLAGLIGLTVATPASALSEAGKGLLERLRNRVESKPGTSSRPVEMVAPPVELKFQHSSPRNFEPGAITIDQSSTSETKNSGKVDAEQTVSTSGDEIRKESKARKARGKKEQKKTTPPLLDPPTPPVSQPQPVVAAEKPAQQPIPAVDAPIPATTAAGSARSFGELSDAELIQYAHENMWSKEKSRKHNPPITPPSKPKKKKKDVKEPAAKASTNKPAKKSGTTAGKTPTTKGNS